LIGNINTNAYDDPRNGGIGDANSPVQTVITAETWWPSPYSGLGNEYLFLVADDSSFLEYDGINGGLGPRKVSAVIDTTQRFVRIDSYTPPILDGDSGTTESHSHLITLQPIVDFTDDYTYGNQSGPGTGRNGLGAAGTQINVTFNQQQVGMELNTGTFTLNTSIKKPIPDVVFSPNRKVPLVPQFHKVKYIIKAF